MAVAAAARPLLEGVELAVQRGERVALLAPSGAGKSTLLKVVAGLQDATAGALELDGKTPEELGWPTYRRRVLYVHQTPVMLDDSVAQNLELPFTFASAGGAFPAERARELLGAVGLDATDVWDRPARRLSVGERQRVALVRALTVAPDCLLLDEPTSALDSATRDAAEALITASSEQAAALIVTHDADQADRLCTRVVDLGPFQVSGT